MLVQRQTRASFPSTFPKSILQYKTNLVWASDGFVYDLEARIKRQFFETSHPKVLQLKEFPSSGVVPGSEWTESVEVTVQSRSPRLWCEKGKDYEEVFAEIPSSSLPQ